MAQTTCGGIVIPKRNFIQKLFGYCPYCGRWFRRVTKQCRITDYMDDKSNWLTSCKECHEEDDAYWEVRWAEYNASRL